MAEMSPVFMTMGWPTMLSKTFGGVQHARPMLTLIWLTMELTACQ